MRLASTTVVLALVQVISGCASSQLNYNTIDIAANVDTLYTKQALQNLGKFVNEPFAIPSQLDFSGGTVQTVNTIQPAVTFPFTSQVAQMAAIGGSAASSRTSTISGSGATITGSNAQQQNYNIIPVDDANALRNLQALYRYAVFGDRDALVSSYNPSRVYVNQRFYYDPYQLERPQCVLCRGVAGRDLIDHKGMLSINERLHGKWLFWDDGSGYAVNADGFRGGDLVDLGHFGDHDLFMTRADFKRGYLTDFVFFILPNSSPSETFQQKGGKAGGAPAPASNSRTSAGRNSQAFPSFKPLGIEPSQ